MTGTILECIGKARDNPLIYLNKQLKTPIYIQLYNALKEEISLGKYGEEPLLSIRALSKELGVSKNSVDQAYQQLLAEGYIYSVPGSGYYCNTIEPVLDVRQYAVEPELFHPPKAKFLPKYNFAYGILYNEDFSWSKWHKCIKSALLAEESAKHLIYGDMQGNYELRKSLSLFLNASRGVNCTASQIIICSGVQDALTLLSALLPVDQFPLGYEEPGYDGSRNTLKRHGYKINPISVTSQGISIDELYLSDSRLVYVTPSHQYPTGYIMPIASRYKLLSFVNERDGYIIEDDYDSEFRYGTLSIPSLQSLDQNDSVIYIGTFSKSFSPTLRMAYLILPKRLLPLFYEKFQNYKTPIPEFVQIAMSEFIKEGYYVRQLRKLVHTNEKKHRLIIQLLQDQKDSLIQPVVTHSGVHMLLRFRVRRTEAELLTFLESQEVKLYPTSIYYSNKYQADEPVLLMGFASMKQNEIRDGIQKLCEVIRQIK